MKTYYARKNNAVVKTFCFLLAFIILFTFSGCDKKSTNTFIITDYFNAPLTVKSYAKKISNDTQNQIELVLKDIENSVSISKENTYVYKFNNVNAGEIVSLDTTSAEIIERAIYGDNSLYNISNKKFNIAVYPLKQLWQNANDNENVITKKIVNIPNALEIENTKKLCVLENVLEFDKENKTINKLIDGAMIDLGGIAKGYAIEKIKDILEKDKITDGYISFGSSSIHIFGVDNLFINHPRQENSKILKINNPKNVSVSTSGDYENVFGVDENGKNYSHIIDTTTGYPTDTGVISATVLGVDNAFLDGVSTTLTLCNVNPNDIENSELVVMIKSLLNIQRDLKFFVVYNRENDKKIITNAPANSFELLDTDYKIINI